MSIPSWQVSMKTQSSLILEPVSHFFFAAVILWVQLFCTNMRRTYMHLIVAIFSYPVISEATHSVVIL